MIPSHQFFPTPSHSQMHTPRSDGFMELYLMPAPRWVEGYSCTALVSLPAEGTGCESGRCRGFECLKIPLMECGELHHWQLTTWLLDHTALWDSLGSPMAMLTVGLEEPVLGWQSLTGPLRNKPLVLGTSAAWITQSWGEFRCAQCT